MTRIGCAASRAALGCAVVVIVGTAIAADAESTQRITPNFKDADITQIAEAVSAATGKNFIIDPRVRAQVTMLSSTPMSPDAFYQAFLSILQVHGFVALPAGHVIKIVPDANARQYPSNDPVSYTHLDVYKRQPPCRAHRPCSRTERRALCPRR